MKVGIIKNSKLIKVSQAISSNMIRKLFVQNYHLNHAVLKKTFSSFESCKLERIQKLKTNQALIKSFSASTDLLDLSALEVGDVFLMFRSMHIRVNGSALKAAGVDGEVLSFVDSNSDLKELGITLPRAKYAVFAKNMKQFKSKGVPTSFLYDHPENQPFLTCDLAWDELIFSDVGDSDDDDDKHKDKGNPASETKNIESIINQSGNAAAPSIVTSTPPGVTASSPQPAVVEEKETDIETKLILSFQKPVDIETLQSILRDIQGPEGRQQSNEAAAGVCLCLTRYLTKIHRPPAALTLYLEMILELCCNRSRVAAFCRKDEEGICADALLNILARKANLNNETLATTASHLLKLLAESGDANMQSVDCFADTILKVMCAHPQNADIVVTSCAALVGTDEDCKKQMYDFASPAALAKTLEKVLGAHKGDLRVAGVIVNTLTEALPGQDYRELILMTAIPKLLVDVISLHSNDSKIVRTVANYITSLCSDEVGVVVFSRLGTVRKLCTALPCSPLLDIFDSSDQKMERWDIEFAIRTLCASTPRDRMLVEVLLGKDRANKIWE